MNKTTEDILRKDTIADTETQLGKHCKDFNRIEEGLALHNAIKDREIKSNHLNSIGDTYWGMQWNEFKTMLVAKGFKKAMCYDIKHDKCIDEFIIYYHAEKGLIVTATSYYNKEKINSGILYGEIQANDVESSRVIWRWLSTGGCIDSEKLIFETSQDIREGLFSILETMESAGKFLNRWSKTNRFLWLLDFTETEVNGYDYKKITNEKIKHCPVEMQKIIGERI